MAIENETQTTWLTADEVVQKLPVPVSVQTLRRWRKAKLFPQAYRIGGRRLAWKAEDIEAWLEKLEPALLECWNRKQSESEEYDDI